MPTPNTASPDAFLASLLQEEARWATSLIELLQGSLRNRPEIALLEREDSHLVPIAATTTLPALPASLLDELPGRHRGALLLPLPERPGNALWIRTRRGAEAIRQELGGWLAAASLALHFQEQKAEKARQRAARDHFFSMVNHDLKSPLSSIKAMSDLIVRKVERGTIDPATEEGGAELMERLHFLSKRVRDLAQLIDEIGDVSSIERGRLHLNPQTNDLGSLLRTQVEEIEERRERSVNIEGRDEAIRLTVDGHRISQVFQILLKNAMDYSPPGTPVTVRLWQGESAACVSITNAGPGIGEEQQARLFQEYGRAVQQAPSGLGVGLYVASALVRAHEGTLELTSEPGDETTVRMTLPLPPPATNGHAG